MYSEIKPIRSEAEYRLALDELRELFMAPKGSKAYDRAEILEILIEDYEEKNYVIEDPDKQRLHLFRQMNNRVSR